MTKNSSSSPSLGSFFGFLCRCKNPVLVAGRLDEDSQWKPKPNQTRVCTICGQEGVIPLKLDVYHLYGEFQP